MTRLPSFQKSLTRVDLPCWIRIQPSRARRCNASRRVGRVIPRACASSRSGGNALPMGKLPSRMAERSCFSARSVGFWGVIHTGCVDKSASGGKWLEVLPVRDILYHNARFVKRKRQKTSGWDHLLLSGLRINPLNEPSIGSAQTIDDLTVCHG